MIRKQNIVKAVPGVECSNQGENTLTQQFRRRAADVLFWLRRFCAPVVCASASSALIKNIYDSDETQILPPTALITFSLTKNPSPERLFYTSPSQISFIYKQHFILIFCKYCAYTKGEEG